MVKEDSMFPKWAVTTFLFIAAIGWSFVMGAISGHDAALWYAADLRRGEVTVTINAPLWSQEAIEKGLDCANRGKGTVHFGGGEYVVHSPLIVSEGVSLKGDPVISSDLRWEGDTGPTLDLTPTKTKECHSTFSNLHIFNADTAIRIDTEVHAVASPPGQQ